MNSRTFSFGLGSSPYLADHGFQNMVVLPGSFFVAMAASLYREAFNEDPRVIENIRFQAPLIISASDSVVHAEFRDKGDVVEYRFFEKTDGTGAVPAANQYAAILEIRRGAAIGARVPSAPPIPEFQKRAQTTISSELYRAVRENGNEYGPTFQNISRVWRDGNEVLAEISQRNKNELELLLDPILLDSATQVLSPFAIDKRQTFILRSIEKLEVCKVGFPDSMWGYAQSIPGHGIAGDVELLDGSGKLLLKMSGIAFELLDRPEIIPKKPATKVVIASNFTAEPVEDSLRFWGDYFDVPLQIEFAAYNQVFQQLLDSGSTFRKNNDGINLILLSLEEWAAKDTHSLARLSNEQAEKYFGARKRFTLPNGLEIAHLNPYETEYVYNEIFEDQCYLKHGIRLRDSATVVDIGANIGLFSLFVMSQCKTPKLYAFEPAPAAFDVLQANCKAYGAGVQAFNLGVSEKPGTATFTFYEKSSVFSGFHSDEADDREAIEAVVRNMLKRVSVADESIDEYVKELSADRLRRSTHECRLTTVSEIIRENHIEKIDLLKIDAEKSELEILRGIADHDWKKIDQVVLEIHDRSRKKTQQVRDILAQRGFHCAIEEDALLANSGLVNLYAVRKAAAEDHPLAGIGSPATFDHLQHTVRDFGAALQGFIKQSSAPVVLCFCPSSPAARSDSRRKAVIDNGERELMRQCSQIPGVAIVDSATLARRYPATDYYDPHTHQAGHIPYTPEGFAAIGTAAFRSIAGLKRSAFKVIALDCDNTLWKGICGEDGWSGVEVTKPHRMLQEFMLEQTRAGVLLCLCSKNNEQDVREVFDRRSDMALRRENVVSWRVNWKSKSENIRSLAAELNLGLDYFIFLDDSPVDCADVRANCPEVLTLQLPQDPELFPSFLAHIWAFDHAGPTAEDQSRTRLYRENADRERFREKAPSLKEFIAGLGLRIDFADAAAADISRVSQLTFRTNQFNLTTIRRSEREISEFLQREGARCTVVRVADRFGDYGLVGVVMYEIAADRYKVDTFLLSCRVLGRGVEHSVLRHLGQQVARDAIGSVELTFRQTDKNLPAAEFLESIGTKYRNSDGSCWTFPAEYLASMEYNPDEQTGSRSSSPAAGTPRESLPQPAAAFGMASDSGRLQRIGEQLYEVGSIAKAIERFRLGLQGASSAEIKPGDTPQTVLMKIWQKVLGRPQVGINENFFEAGGTSLKAVQVLAMIKRELKQSLSIASIFECPTIALLAAKLSGATDAPRSDERVAGAALRGRQRRYKTARNSPK